MTAALLAALCLIESGNDPSAIGRGGEVGILQITRPVVLDVNRITGSRYRWPEDCLDPAMSEEICRLYLIHYAGWAATDEKLARIWNGGPRGHLKRSTLTYWAKVQKQLSLQSATKQTGNSPHR